MQHGRVLAAELCPLDGASAVLYTLRVKVRELIRPLERDGWVVVRTRGSRRQLHHSSKLGTVTVSGGLGVDVPTGTLRSALKQADLIEEKE